jgi:hypothetical protein
LLLLDLATIDKRRRINDDLVLFPPHHVAKNVFSVDRCLVGRRIAAEHSEPPRSPADPFAKIANVLVASTLSTAANFATAAAVLVAAIALLLQRGQARTEFEDDLVREYRKTIKPPLVTKALISPDLDKETIQQVAEFYPYIDLCNEQTFLRMAGRVGGRTWRQWSEGIEGNLERRAFADAWKTIREQSPNDFKELQLLDDSGFSSDPRSWIPLWLRLRLWLARHPVTTELAARRVLHSTDSGKPRNESR